MCVYCVLVCLSVGCFLFFFFLFSLSFLLSLFVVLYARDWSCIPYGLVNKVERNDSGMEGGRIEESIRLNKRGREGEKQKEREGRNEDHFKSSRE